MTPCFMNHLNFCVSEKVGVSHSSSVTERGALAAPADHHPVLTGQSVARFLCCTGFSTLAFVLCSPWHCRHKVSYSFVRSCTKIELHICLGKENNSNN